MKVSVCVLTYNGQHVIDDAVDSILRQSFQNFELIISDDHSNAETQNVLDALTRRHPRVKLIRTPANGGMAANANFAVEHATGEYIALLHQDDICREDLLERWVELAELAPTVSFVFNEYQTDEEPEGAHALEGRPFTPVMKGRRFRDRFLLGAWGCPVRGTALIRRSAWNHVHGMRPHFGMLADVDLWMRLCAVGDVGYVSDSVLRVRHLPPAEYPADYVRFTWRRQELLYRIHGTNIREAGASRARLALFRSRVMTDVLKWLAYGVIRQREDMIFGETNNEYDTIITRSARRSARVAFRLRKRLRAWFTRPNNESGERSDSAHAAHHR